MPPIVGFCFHRGGLADFKVDIQEDILYEIYKNTE